MGGRGLERQVLDLDADGLERLAGRLVAADPDAAKGFAQLLERRLGVDELSRIERVWGLSGAEVAQVFGVSREAYRKWRVRVPADRAAALAQLDRATDTLLSKVRIDRIPAVVRTAAPLLGGRSLLDVATTDGPGAVSAAVDSLFDLRRVQP